jgi:GTP cyclohydrolase I
MQTSCECHGPTEMPRLFKTANENIPHTEAQKNYRIERAAHKFGEFLDELGFDWRSDPNSQDTPLRVAKEYVLELIKGNYEESPKITSFPNTGGYNGMICQNNIEVTSLCSHHWQTIKGYAHVAYIPSKNGKVIGLSKINRVVDFFARRPQLQESLTTQIHSFINKVCEHNHGVAVMIEAKHGCCSNRGIKHDSCMRTAYMSGAFLKDKDQSRAEFYKFIEFGQNRGIL